MYDEYLNERQEVEVETIKTLVEEPVVPGEPMAGNHHLEHPVGPCCPCPYACLDDNVGCCGEEELETNTNANGTSTAGEGEAQQPGAPNPTEEEPSEEFREQLQNVQKQLEALSALPNTIQATIAALTEQLAVLAAPKRKSKSISPRPEGILVVR